MTDQPKTVLQEVAEIERRSQNSLMRDAVIDLTRLLATRVDELAGRLDALEQQAVRAELASLGGHLLSEYGDSGMEDEPLATLGGYLLSEYGGGRHDDCEQRFTAQRIDEAPAGTRG